MELAHIKQKYGQDLKFYRLLVPEITAEASQIFFDLFNASGTSKKVIVTAIYGIPKGDVAVTGVVSVRADVFRTSAIGTGGTSATANGASSSACTFVKMDSTNEALPSGITARKEPTGGATADDWISTAHLFSEETNAGLYALQNQDLLRDSILVLKEGEGLSVVQGSVASVNNYSFIVDFAVV